MNQQTQTLEVWGDYACFTRPELKVERFSYPIMTPSAARGIFDSIYWKPDSGFYWQVTSIRMLSFPRYIALRRNEVKEKISESKIKKYMKNQGAEVGPLFADMSGSNEGRTQRQTMALKKPHYGISAYPVFFKSGQEKEAEVLAQFRRRAARGQCFQQPYLGLREFPAFFCLRDDALPPAVPYDQNVGVMLYDVFNLSAPGSSFSGPSISVFTADIRHGELTVPCFDSVSVTRVAP